MDDDVIVTFMGSSLTIHGLLSVAYAVDLGVEFSHAENSMFAEEDVPETWTPYYQFENSTKWRLTPPSGYDVKIERIL